MISLLTCTAGNAPIPLSRFIWIPSSLCQLHFNYFPVQIPKTPCHDSYTTLNEAGFGRINKPKRCWCPKGQRPSVPCHHIREYRYAFGAVEPLSGESFFLTMPNCDTECTNIFLEKLSEQYPDDIILLVCDGAAWHKSKALRCPENIQLLSIPPYTPEMNPIEQIWKQIRSMGFRNEVFDSLSAVMDRLCETICLLTTDMVKSITGRQWIIECF